MTQEEKAKAYDEALERAKDYYKANQIICESEENEVLSDIFPELKECEDERIRKAILTGLIDCRDAPDLGWSDFGGIVIEDCIAWLEKQGEQKEYTFKSLPRLLDMIEPTSKAKAYCQKLIDTLVKEGYFTDAKIVSDCLKRMNGEKVAMATMDEQKLVDNCEPKFHEGDWVVNKLGDSWHIDSFDKKNYQVSDGKGNYNYFPISKQDEMHLWTIDDATDGDVLSYITDEDDLWIMIYWSLYKPYEGHVHYHALLVNNDFSDKGTCCICIDNLKPATKEQRDLLFQKMKEADYEWVAEKKELKKMEQPMQHPNAIDMSYLQNWYQDSIDETKEPIWTDQHLEELFNDFYLIPKSK